MVNLKDMLNEAPFSWPKGLDKEILRVLRDRNAPEDDRQAAAQLAGDYVVVNEQLLKTLIQILTDATESLELRQHAASAFGPALETMDLYDPELDDPELEELPCTMDTFEKIKATLKAVFESPDTPDALRRSCLDASVRACQDWHPEAIRKAWQHPDTPWKHCAAFGMTYVKGLDQEILQGLKSKDPVILGYAVEAAGNWSVKGAAPAVLKILRAKNTAKDLLLTAIEAIPSLLPEEAAEILMDFCDSEDEDIAGAAMEACQMGDLYDDEDEEEAEAMMWQDLEERDQHRKRLLESPSTSPDFSKLGQNG